MCGTGTELKYMSLGKKMTRTKEVNQFWSELVRIGPKQGLIFRIGT
jgi:hypothetical protein